VSGSEVRAVGIQHDGTLLAIRSASSMRGLILSGIILSPKHRSWFKDNEETLRACFHCNPGKEGTVIIVCTSDSIAEVF